MPARTGGLRAGARRAIPILPPVVAFAATFGVLADAAGFSPLAAVLMSATTFAGSAQLGLVSVLEAGGTLAAALVTAIVLNIRYLAYGLAVAPSLRGSAIRRGTTGALLTDESWALSHLGGGRYDPVVLVGASLALFAAWVGGTALGVAMGGVVEDPAALGLDVVFPAIFLALLAPSARQHPGLTAAAAGLSLVLVPLVPAGLPVVGAALLAFAWERG